MDREERTEELLARFFPNVSVQMRTALSNLYFSANALAAPEAREKDPALDRTAAVLDQNYYRLLRLANHLDAAAYFNRAEELSLQDRDIAELTADFCEKADSLAKLMGLTLHFRCTEGQHLCAIHERGLRQILSELLSNAFKFTPPGGEVTVELQFKEGKALLSVSDTGCGVPEELIPTLFDRYLHDERMDLPAHGLGLGLPLCRRIAEKHGGSILAANRAEKGLRVTAAIPDRRSGVIPLSDLPVGYTGGFNPTLLSLADALPTEAFLLNEQ